MDAAAPTPATNHQPRTTPTLTPNPQPRIPALRSGITLLELLIVMLILLMITAAAIPVVAPAMRNRQMREATRMVNSFIGAAKARALSTGRPCGVQIERFNGLPFAFQLSQIEMPPPYAGDLQSAKTLGVQIVSGPPSPNTQARAGVWPYQVWLRVAMDQATFNYALIRVGDTIQLGGQGHVYTVFGPDEEQSSTIGNGVIDVPENVGDPIILEVAYVSNTPITGSVFFPWPINTGALNAPLDAAALSFNIPYQVNRQPVRTTTPPMVLPEGLCVDLSVSGVGDSLFNLFNSGNYNMALGGTVPEPVVLFDPQILFSPSGRVEWVSGAGGKLARATEPVYLLLGRRELMFDVTNRMDPKDIVFQNLSPVPNPADTAPAPAENFWVVIGPQTGQVTSAEVAPNYQDYQNAGGYGLTNFEDVIKLALTGIDPTNNKVRTGAREFARDSQGLGGR